MRVIGVTGGVGAGKSTVLGILEEDFQAYVIQADQLGHILMEPGEECYDAVIALFGKEIIKKDKTIDRKRISDVVFTDKDMLLKLNGIIHPAVKQRILDLLGEQKDAGRGICVVEAALFLEENYQEFCDETLIFASMKHLEYGNIISPQFPILLVLDVLYARYLQIDRSKKEALHEYTIQTLQSHLNK